MNLIITQRYQGLFPWAKSHAVVRTADVDTFTILFPKLLFSILVSLIAAVMKEFSFSNLAFLAAKSIEE